MTSRPLPLVSSLTLLTLPVSAKTTWLFVQVQDSDARIGVGEATLPRQEAAVEAAFGPLARAHVARPADADARWAWDHVPRTLAGAAAASAIDHALWDLAAQRAGRPLAQLLGATAADVPMYANVNRGLASRGPIAFADAARAAVQAGFPAVKIAPFDEVDVHGRWGDPRDASDASLARGLERVSAVRDAIGVETALLVDCHWRFDEPWAIRAIDALRELALHWIECPVPEDAHWLPVLRRLRDRVNRSGTLLAGGEDGVGREAFDAWLDAGAYDVLMPDIKYVGGIAEMRAVAARAALRNVAIAPHNPSGPIAHAVSAHVCATLPAFDRLELQVGESPLFQRIVTPPMPAPRDGRQPLPIMPGLGVAIDEVALRANGGTRRRFGRTLD